MEDVLHGAKDNEDEELPDVSGGGHVVIVYKAMVFGCSSKGSEEYQEQLHQAGVFGLQGKEIVTQPFKPDLMITLDEDILLKNGRLELVNIKGCLGLNKTKLSL